MIWKYSDSSNTAVYRINENGDYITCKTETIADWIASGNSPLPADVVVILPTEITARQARLALLTAGFLDQVEAFVPTLSREASIEWEFSAIIRRNHQLVLEVQDAIGWTDTQLDDLFILAASL